MSEGVKLVLSMLLSIFVMLAIAMPIALIPAQIAKKKGHSWILWWLYGTFAIFYAAVAFTFWWVYDKPIGFEPMTLVLLIGLALFALPFVHAIKSKPGDQGSSYDADVMFGQMVESREKKTSTDKLIYFLDTMGVWITFAFIVVAIGVLATQVSPSEQSQAATLVKAEPPPAAAAPPPPAEAPKPQAKQEVPEIQGVQNVKEAPSEIVKEAPAPKPPPPTVGAVTGGVAGGVPGGVPGGIPGGVPGGIPGGVPTGEAAPPPPPPPPEPEKKEPPKIIRKSGGVLAGEALSRPEPAYPPLAKAARVSGAVVVEVTISEEGQVISARALSGHPLLKDAATSAASRWRFKPTLLSGVPVKVIGTITFNFNL